MFRVPLDIKYEIKIMKATQMIKNEEWKQELSRTISHNYMAVQSPTTSINVTSDLLIQYIIIFFI